MTFGKILKCSYKEESIGFCWESAYSKIYSPVYNRMEILTEAQNTCFQIIIATCRLKVSVQ